jgi:hypothetical protein
MSARLRAPATKERTLAALAVAVGGGLLLMTAFRSDSEPIGGSLVEPTTESSTAPSVLGSVVEPTTTTTTTDRANP